MSGCRVCFTCCPLRCKFCYVLCYPPPLTSDVARVVQSQHALELHARNLKDEQAAIFNFLTVVRLVSVIIAPHSE